ncbi:unnamed protein product [Pleuronectes platessa]|uniref:Uncharacterized protein n=1 Tax=Pleuronectes platessa TaxID=8262 RepID=A0A9N7Z0A9_PLEPL|nr:unnamed protein product [Pleuronectes platessa]
MQTLYLSGLQRAPCAPCGEKVHQANMLPQACTTPAPYLLPEPGVCVDMNDFGGGQKFVRQNEKEVEDVKRQGKSERKEVFGCAEMCESSCRRTGRESNAEDETEGRTGREGTTSVQENGNRQSRTQRKRVTPLCSLRRGKDGEKARESPAGQDGANAHACKHEEEEEEDKERGRGEDIGGHSASSSSIIL